MKIKAHAATLVGNFFFGCSVLAIKQLSPQYMPPLAVNVARIITALILFWGLFFINYKNNKKIEKKDWLRLIACAFTGIILNQILFVKGSSITSPIHASLLGLSTPIAIMLLSFIVYKQPIKKQMGIGVLLGIVGATLLIFLKSPSDKQSSILGDVLIILNATSYAAYLILAKPLLGQYKPITVITWAFTIGAFVIIPMGLQDFLQVDFKEILAVKQNIIALLFICVGATFISYVTIMYGIAKLGSQVVGTYIYTQPIFATTAAIILYKEPLNGTKIIAALCIFLGVYLVSNSKK